MKALQTLIFPRSSIPYLLLQFPSASAVPQCRDFLRRVSARSPAMFVSLHGANPNPAAATTLFELLGQASQQKKVPLYTFLEDDINGLTYQVAKAGHRIIANPYCRMGDLQTHTKVYRNVSKVLDYFGVKYENVGGRVSLYDARVQPNQAEAEFTGRWLQQVGQQLSAGQSPLPQLLHPSQALSLNLVHHISTAEQFQAVHFPNCTLRHHHPRQAPPRRTLTSNQLSMLSELVQLMAMPRVALMAHEQLLQGLVDGLVELVRGRLQGEGGLEELEEELGRVMAGLAGEGKLVL